MTSLIAKKIEEARSLLPGMRLPSREHESWRKVNLSGLQLDSFRAAESEIVVLECKDAVVLTGSDAAQALEAALSDDRFALSSSPEDIFECQTLGEPSQIVYIRTGNAAHVRIRHSLKSGNRLTHRVFVEVKDASDASIIEEFHGSAGQDLTLWNSHTDIFAGGGSSVRHLSIRDYAGNEWNFHRLRAAQGRDSSLHSSIVHSSGHTGKTFVTSKLLQPGASFRGVGMTTLAGREFLDVEMCADHPADHTSSSLHYKTVLKGRSHSVFNGNLIIHPGVKDVGSHQINNNVLLDPRARAESQPRLVIQSEEVSAEHGATVGEIDREALFFLMSRGIPESDSRQLLMTGFLTQITEELPLSEEEKERIVSSFLKRLYESA